LKKLVGSFAAAREVMGRVLCLLAVWDGSLLEAQTSVASTVPEKVVSGSVIQYSVLISSSGSGLIEGHGGFT